MDENIKTDLEKEDRTSANYLDEYVWDEVKDGLFIKRSINYHKTFERIAKEVISDELKKDNPKR